MKHLLVRFSSSGVIVTVAGAAVLAVAIGWLCVRGSSPNSRDAMVLTCFALAIAATSPLQVRLVADGMTSPVASAIGLGLALSSGLPGGHLMQDGTPLIIVTAAVGLLAGWVLLRLTTGRLHGLSSVGGCLIAIAVAALLYRQLRIFDGHSALNRYDVWGDERWRTAAAMAAAALIAGAVLVVASVEVYRDGRPLLTALKEVAPLQGALSVAVASTATAIALGLAPLGVLAIPLMAAPLVLLRFAMRQQTAVIDTRRQTIAALSMLTDVAGYTPSGHAARVAALSKKIGRLLHLGDKELAELEDAALLHDIGQVSLASPIPGGSTIDVAPSDQRSIAEEGTNIVRRTEVLDGVADIMQAQATQYRNVRERGEDVPIASRIIKVCNAFEDLTGGDPALRDVAIERLTLGLGYEYDPTVLDLLARVTADA